MHLTEKQLAQVDAQVKRLIKTDSYYGKKYRELGIQRSRQRKILKESHFQTKLIFGMRIR